MFSTRYFNLRYFAARYFPKLGGIITLLDEDAIEIDITVPEYTIAVRSEIINIAIESSELLIQVNVNQP